MTKRLHHQWYVGDLKFSEMQAHARKCGLVQGAKITAVKAIELLKDISPTLPTDGIRHFEREIIKFVEDLIYEK